MELELAAAPRTQSERPLGLVSVLVYVGAGRFPCILGRVEDAHVTAAGDVDRGEPSAERAGAVDHDGTLVGVVRKRVWH